MTEPKPLKIGFSVEELAARIREDTQGRPQENIHKPLPPELEDITRHTKARIVGCDETGCPVSSQQELRDIAALVLMNNSLVLRTEDLEKQLADGSDDDQHKTIEDYAKSGWHASAVSETGIGKLLHQVSGGYAFLLEYEKDGRRVPYGYQVGFADVPPDEYPSLSPKSLPDRQIFKKHSQDTFTIWRTGIVETMESVREDFAKIGLPIPQELLGKRLHRLGAGQATKVVAAEAAASLKKQYIQFNIGQLVRPGSLEDIVARNEASMGSNREIFDELEDKRWHIDHILGSKNQPLVDISWRMFLSDPKMVLQRLFRPQSVVHVKGWDTEQLQHTGVRLAKLLKNGETPAESHFG